MMDEMGYYDAGIKVGKMYEKERILRFLKEKKKRNEGGEHKRAHGVH